jgi:ubiquinone/menaquinone biosynthesis C-methylase UbiE
MAEYDAIAELYQKAKQHPWRQHIEAFTYQQLLGDLAGKAVLDLACGEGHYTRMIRRLGAARVVGVDISSRMIELARKQEAANPLGIDYHVGDGARLAIAGSFDLVTAAYLLNYSRTYEELQAMANGIARNLKPGGRFVAINDNPDHALEHYAGSRPYGFIKSIPTPVRHDGTTVTLTFFVDGQTFQFQNFYMSRPTVDAALERAGFRTVRRHPPQVAPAGLAEFGRDYWQEFLDHPPVIFIEAVK